MSTEDDVINESCRSSLGKGCLRSFNPLIQGGDKVGGGAPTEGDSSMVYYFDIKAL